MVHVRQISSLDQLDQLHLVWKSLWQQTINGGFLRSLDWLRLLSQFQTTEVELRVLVVTSGSETVGILPLTCQRNSTAVGPVRSLAYARWGDHLIAGPVGPNPTATLTAALRHLAEHPRDWDLLELNCDKHDRNRTELTMQRAGVLDSIQSQHYLGIDIQSGWRDYLNSRPVSLLREMHGIERHARKCGKVEFERSRPLGAMADDSTPRWDLVDECQQVSQHSAVSQPPIDSASTYFRETHLAAAALGALDISVLRFDGSPIACSYAFHHQGRVEKLTVVEDERFAPLNPVKLLLGRLIADSCRREDHRLETASVARCFDPRWGTHSEPRTSLRGSARTFRGQMARGLRAHG